MLESGAQTLSTNRFDTIIIQTQWHRGCFFGRRPANFGANLLFQPATKAEKGQIMTLGAQQEEGQEGISWLKDWSLQPSGA